MVIPVYAQKPGTFHHIYPKSELVRPLRRIEQVFIYYTEPKRDGEREGEREGARNGADKAEVTKLKELRNVIIRDQSAHDYYWNPGTGFGGVCPEFRTDDPGNDVEKVRPNGMPDYFESAKTVRPNKFNKLASDIENSTLNMNVIEDCIDIEKKLQKEKVYCTVKSDWNVEAGYGDENRYGVPARIYSIKRNGNNAKDGFSNKEPWRGVKGKGTRRK